MDDTNIYPAATIMLCRDFEGHLEVLLLQRNKALAFAAGQWVFPGGRVEEEEMEIGTDELDAAKIAAIRETKEEAGIEVEKEALIFTRHWTTPAVEKRRFATWFFFAGMKGASPKVQIDDGEIKAYQWIRPQVALEQFKRGELAMLPPTFLNLQLIRTCQSVEEAENQLQGLKPIHVVPRVQLADGAYNVMYKGDAGYETTDRHAVGARHRLTIHPLKRIIQFEHQDCEHFPPVNGGDDFFS